MNSVIQGNSLFVILEVSDGKDNELREVYKTIGYFLTVTGTRLKIHWFDFTPVKDICDIRGIDADCLEHLQNVVHVNKLHVP